jgi:chlorobactene glucosyltransferase
VGRLHPQLRQWAPWREWPAPLVSVVVPARNERHNIERCVRSLLESTYPTLEVIVVDDRSTDDTASIVQQIAHHDARLRLVRGEEPPAGWFGKSWACWQGYRDAGGDYLLFTDADASHGPELLPRAMTALADVRADLLTVLPHQECVSFWERVVQPQSLVLIATLFGSLDRVNRNTNPRRAIANGQFLLTTRDAYEDVGTHAKVHDEVVEDVALAQAYLRIHRRVRVVAATDDMSVRMYTSLRGIAEGWTKNLFLGLRLMVGDPRAAYLAVALMMVAVALWLLPPALAALSHRLAPAPATFGIVATAAGLAHWLVVLWYLRVPVWYAPLYPLGVVVMLTILSRAVWRGTRRIEWKGRVYAR